MSFDGETKIVMHGTMTPTKGKKQLDLARIAQVPHGHSKLMFILKFDFPLMQ